MAQIDPNIILGAVQQQRAGTSPFSNLQHIIQFQDLIEQRKQRSLKIKKQETISDLIGKNIHPSAEGITLDKPKFIQQLAQEFPALAFEQQEIVRKQAIEAERLLVQKAKLEAQKAKAIADEKIAIAKASKAELERAADIQDVIASAAGAVLNAKPENQQDILDKQLDRLIDQKIISAEMLQSGKLPLTVTPESLSQLRAIQHASLTSKEQLDFALEERKLKGATEKEKDKKVEELSKKQFKQSSDLRKEFSKLSGDFVKQKAAFERVQASAEKPSAAGDLALIFNFMKVLDPGSTVREGEFATAAKAAGLPEQIVASILRIESGKKLGPKQRKDFVNRSFKLFDKAKKAQARLRSQFIGIAKKNNLDPDQSVLLFNEGVVELGNDRTDFKSTGNKGTGSRTLNFNSVEAANKANLPKGTIITINGRKAVVE